jgi:PsbP-like protein
MGMKTKYLGLIALVIVVVVMASGCSRETGYKTYIGQGITFNYPDTWTIDEKGKIKTPNNVIGGIDIFSIKVYASDPEYTGEATFIDVVNDDHQGRIGTYDRKDVNVSGSPGILYIPTGSQGNVERADLYFAKDDTIYNIFVTPTQNYDQEKQGFEMIVNTVKFQ